MDAGRDSAPAANVCPSCVTDKDCNGDVCAQFGSDIYCAPACPKGTECSADRACTIVSSVTGAQLDVCVPRGDVCGANVGPTTGTDAGAASDSGAVGDAGGPSGTCGTLNGPSVLSACNSCGTHACQPNGCYGGWWCNTATKTCQAPPTSCGTPPPPDAGTSSDSGSGGAPDAGPVTGGIGPTGGSESRLYFAVIGDTRPPAINDTSAYPTAVITKIFDDINALNPRPPFLVTTGDYLFSSANGTAAAPQLDLYLGARAHYAGISFPTMGNHECTGAVTSNCGPGTTDGVTANYSAYLSKMLTPIAKQEPYYGIDIKAVDSSWTAKFLFVAANAWSPAQNTWFQGEMARPTTYTFIVRHEPKAASNAPGVGPSEQIMAQYPYTLALVGHTHTYGHTAPKQVTIGNGGAPLTGSVNYGFGLISQRPDLSIQVDMIDFTTGQPDTNFRFAVHPDGTPAP